ncbi:MAG: type II toxin-antitoxin system VapC family toxin [Thermodesulfovibrionia bacterium]|nr:type II toxin-antitoxin system VapC family toxin [Thermodesulfovibrionia bacterium]
MRNVLIDTDIIINFLRGKEKAKQFLLSLVDEAVICCSVISVAEIFAGMKEKEKPATTELIDSLHVIDINREIAEKAGEYKRFEKRQSLELDDCFVAAAAFHENAVLATGNAKHYPMTDIEKVTVTA